MQDDDNDNLIPGKTIDYDDFFDNEAVDTQKLIDTQKSLMMMLGTMKPMLSDGKQLIDTFNQMFGPNAMAQIGASGSEALAQAAPPTADSLAANAGKTTTSK